MYFAIPSFTWCWWIWYATVEHATPSRERSFCIRQQSRETVQTFFWWSVHGASRNAR